MENASKALIIAGAILLAILLISLGIMIFGEAQAIIDDSGMDEFQISTFNSQWLEYEGTEKGSMVKKMINDVIASNQSEGKLEAQIHVTFKGNSIIGEEKDEDGVYKIVGSPTRDISNSKTYEITMTYTGARISKIEIVEP